MPHAVVLGEALVDLLDGECGGQRVYRQTIGGAPLNVAVGAARLGASVEFAGSVGADTLGDRIAAFLDGAGVGTANLIRVPAPTTLAVATYDGAEPEFQFYGDPPSYAAFGPGDLDEKVVAGAGVLYCGSISLLHPSLRAAAERAWRIAGPLRVFDPNVRPSLLTDGAALAHQVAVVEHFAATADLVKLSAADAQVLYKDVAPAQGARRLREMGAATVVVTRGPEGALVVTGDGAAELAAPQVRAVDATGAGDSVMGALVAQLLAGGAPADLAGWQAYVDFALKVAGLVCESPGGAVSMPTRDDVARRFPDQSAPSSSA
jgi:fructokinase